MELRKHGVTIRLQEQPLRVLANLVERPGEIVTREELQQQIWGKNTFVYVEKSLKKAVNRLREALKNQSSRSTEICGNSSAPRISIHRAGDRAQFNATTPNPGAPQFSLRCEAGESGASKSTNQYHRYFCNRSLACGFNYQRCPVAEEGRGDPRWRRPNE